MGGRGSGSSRSKSGGGGGLGVAQPQVQQQTPPQQAPIVDNSPFGTMSDAEAQAMYDANKRTYRNPEFVSAQKLYISSADAKGDGYSFSQNLNYKLDNGLKLDANESWMNNNLQNGMHAIGKNTKLVRYCHDDILQSAGVKDYTKLSQAQLQSKLVGTVIQTKAYTSTSYNASKSPFAPGAPQGGGREVVMNIKAGANTKVMLGAKAQTEIVMNKGTNLRITGIRFDNSSATPRNKGTRQRVILDVEAY